MAIVWQYAHRASSIVTILFYSCCKKIIRLTRDRSFNPLILGKLLFLTLPFNLQKIIVTRAIHIQRNSTNKRLVASNCATTKSRRRNDFTRQRRNGSLRRKGLTKSLIEQLNDRFCRNELSWQRRESLSLFIIITRKNEDSIGTIQIDSNLQSILRGRTVKKKKKVGKDVKDMKNYRLGIAKF